MTEQEQRIAIAESCGIHVCPYCFWEIDPELCHCGDTVKNHTSEHNAVPAGCTCGYSDAENLKAKEPQCPDYLNDLNAMHEAEKCLTMEKELLYLDELSGIIMNTGYEDDQTYRATARQRAEAFLRTIGKWKE